MRLNYAIEGLLLGIFMVVASLVGIMLYSGLSPFDLPWNATVKRFVAGCTMGLTAMALIYSPLGRRSGAHLNPAVSLAFLYLKKIEPRHAFGYVIAQFAGASLGVGLAAFLWGSALRAPTVRYAATTPGTRGALAALVAEALISFVLMSVVLRASNTLRLARFTGVFAGILIATYITFEAPISGMSMNPARTFGSNVFAMAWSSYWVYVLGPCAGMLGAAALFRATGGRARCAKLMHDGAGPCAFSSCEY